MALRESKSSHLLAPALIVVIFFSAIAPTLTWPEFSSGSENLNVATALEIRRTGHWLIPTLQDKPRVAKPPLTAWITASLISSRTMQGLSSGDAAVRHAAQDRLAWQVRWPALLMSCLTLLGIYSLGRTLFDEATGIAAAMVLGTTYAFLRFSRGATTDVTLTLFVTVADVFIAKALFEEAQWRNWALSGIALGLALLCKGPVALVQTIAPAGVFLLVKGKGGGRIRLAPVVVGIALMLLVGMGWYVLVLLKMQSHGEQIAQIWFREVTREDATDLSSNPPYVYLVCFLMLLPWLVFFIGGMWQVFQTNSSRLGRGLWFLAIWFFVPILIMVLFRDRKDRYLLPMMGPGACLAGFAVIEHARKRGAWNVAEKTGEAVHWLIVLGVGVGFPIVASTRLLTTVSGVPWLDLLQGVVIGGACLGVLLCGVMVYRQYAWALTIATMLMMLAVQYAFMAGYAKSSGGRSAARPLADAILREHPKASIYSYIPKRREPEDLSIYTNQVVTQVPDPSEVKANNAILVVLDRSGREAPAIPAGWRLFATVPEGQNHWLAYERANPGD